MDNSHSLSSSELQALLDRKYTAKSFTRNGNWITHLILQDKGAGGKAIGKLVDSSSEEFRQRPWLHHRNLTCLIDMITINEDFSIFVSDFQEKCLRQIIHEEAFVNSSYCFAHKKSYIEDVLCGLDYLHKNNLCLMNLSDANVFICEKQHNKAIITDFGSLSAVKNSSKGNLAAPFIHQPPELRMADGAMCDHVAAEMWLMGMMVLEVFTQHKLPWALVDYNPDQVLQMIDKVDCGILKVANSGSTISIQDFCEFKEFVDLFIDADPGNRSSAKNATSAKFLQSSKNNVSLQKSPQRPPRKINDEDKIVSANSPSIFKIAVDNNIKHHYDIFDDFKTSKNPKGKSFSNVSFKKCVDSLKQMSFPDLKSNYIRPSKYADCEDNCHSETMNQDYERNSKSKSIFNLDLLSSQEDAQNIFCHGIKSPTKIQSKLSVSSQTESTGAVHKHSAFEKVLNTDIAIDYKDNSPNQANNSFSINIPFDTYNYTPNATREMLNTTEIENEKPKDLRKKLSPETQISTNLINKFCEKLRAPCDTNNCASLNYDYYGSMNNLLKSASDQLNSCRMIPNQNIHNDSNINKKKNYKKFSKPTVYRNNSLQKFHIPISKYRPLEPLRHQHHSYKTSFCHEIEKLKFETKTASKTSFTFPKSKISDSQSFQSTVRNTSDSMSTAGNGKKKNLEQSDFKKAQKEPIKLLKEIEDPNIKFTEIKTQSNNNYDPPPVVAMSLDFRKISDDVQANVNENRYCRFRHGPKCPIHQKAQILRRLNATTIKDEVIRKGNKEKASESKSQTLENRLNEEQKASRKLSELAQGCPLPHEHWCPTTLRGDTTKPPIPSPSSLSYVSAKKLPTASESKTIGCATHNEMSASPALPNWNELVKSMSNHEVKCSEDFAAHRHPPKFTIIRGPRNLVTAEIVETKHAKTAKKNEVQYASTDSLITQDISEEKKESKKKNAKKICFCI